MMEVSQKMKVYKFKNREISNIIKLFEEINVICP